MTFFNIQIVHLGWRTKNTLYLSDGYLFDENHHVDLT